MTFDLATISTAVAAEKGQNDGARQVVTTPTGGGTRRYANFQSRSATSKKLSPPRDQTPGRHGRADASATVATGTSSRPKSPARTGSRSRDIVQEVYDRMGVNYVRGKSSMELDDSTSTISIHSGTKSVTKSPSRNRANARYLYTNNTHQAATDPDARSPRSSFSSGRAASRWSSARSVTSTASKAGDHHPVVAYPSNKASTPRSSSASPTERDEDGSFPSAPRKQPSVEVDSREAVEDRDAAEEDCGREADEQRDAPSPAREDCDGRTSPLSVKSRISAFSNYGGARGSFGNSKRMSETSWSMDASGKVVTPVALRKGAKSGLANSYMAAINGTKAVAPAPVTRRATHQKARPSDFSITSIPVRTSPFGAIADDHSVAPSEISVEDFTAIAPRKEPSRIVSGKSKPFSTSSLTKEKVDQMIDEKIQAQFDAMQKGIESQLRLVEAHAIERLDELEKRLNALAGEPEKEQTEEQVLEQKEVAAVTKEKTHSVPEAPFFRPYRR
ncbi:MAG: hypothetical protein SGILL_004858 [Bacillariaceae sp.]